MKKIVIVLINLLSFSCLLNGMELEDLSKKKQEVTPHNGITPMHLDLGPDVLNNRLNLTTSTGRGTVRTPLSGIHQVDTLLKARSVAQQKSQRSTTSSTMRQRRLDELNPEQLVVNIADINGDTKKLSTTEMMSHSTDVKGLEELLVQGKIDALTEEEKWTLFAKWNRPAYTKIYPFAQSHGKNFDEAMIFWDLLNEFDFDPVFVVEHVKQINSLNKKKATNWEVEHYKNLQTSTNEQDKEKYEALVLGVMAELFEKHDASEGAIAKPSTVHNEHLAVQENKITEQVGTLKKFKVGTVLHLIITFATISWGLYAQVYGAVGPHGGGTNCTG